MADASRLINITDPTLRQPPPGQTRPYPSPSATGRIPFPVPGTAIESETYYLLYGELTSSSVPLICLHGGPGVGHNYLLTLSHLSTGSYARPVILYDQIGCGLSTHFREKKGDTTFWTLDLFIAELRNLTTKLGITTYDVLGQSWGGMLGAEFASRQPQGLRRLVIADSPSDMITWVAVAAELRGLLDPKVQEVLNRCESEERYDEEYEAAMADFYKYFVCRTQPMAEEFTASMQNVHDDDTVYMTMNGPSEFHVIGSLKKWDIRPELHKIKVPVLLINGKFDEAQDITLQPYFQLIKTPVKWIRFAESAHCPHLEETDDYMEAVGRWLHDDV